MNEKIMRKAGFNNEMDRVKNKKCPICSCAINMTMFRDAESIREYTISGLCQHCQDSVFGVINNAED